MNRSYRPRKWLRPPEKMRKPKHTRFTVMNIPAALKTALFPYSPRFLFQRPRISRVTRSTAW
jgi:hypothetical protein